MLSADHLQHINVALLTECVDRNVSSSLRVAKRCDISRTPYGVRG